jgi:hypothetical protein
MTWIFYILGQILHIALRANLAVKSRINGVEGYRRYFDDKGALIAARFFLATCFFMVGLYGEGLFPQYFPKGGDPRVIAAIAGIFGYAADSILDKGMAKLGLDKEIPHEDDLVAGEGSAGGIPK